MFTISEQTKETAIIELNRILPGHTPDELAEAFDACVDIVKKQFGM